ncbi:hypothetical protein G7Y79_00015g039810 [Physcia stellaris]|nr:hypothetical protein G7Y79_00015g039810 [Physcia stellaris]
MEGTQDASTPPPFKKRKFYRKRAQLEDEVSDIAKATESLSSPSPSELLTLDEMIVRHSNGVSNPSRDQDGELSVAELLRHRRALQRRKGGIGFANVGVATSMAPPAPQSSNLATEEEGTTSKFVTVADRFAPQTGQVADVDQHMMAYIDSELARRRQTQQTSSHDPNIAGFGGLSASGTIDAAVQRQPAALGKLHEIDLGPDATLTNIARTEAAKRRLEDGTPEVEEYSGKVRLGRDGKPRRSRKRRNSDDIKRDKLVEEILKESKLDIYDEPEIELANDDQAADDRIAEQFRREFMDAVSQRRQKPTQPAKKPGPGVVDESHKGPKLGGSRSARAAMRELQEKAKKK